MSDIENLVGLLQIVKLSGGEIRSRIKIQKEAFLLASQDVASFSLSEFSYHHYGPYSRSLSAALQLAVSADLLNETHEGGEDQDFTRYTYILTPNGEQFLSQFPNASDEFGKFVRFCKDMHWRALELAATVRFLEVHKAEFNRDSAFQQALSLKPKTKPFLSKAKKILSEIRQT